MNDITVRYLDGNRFLVAVRGHTVLVDQPIEAGGVDSAPTPTELFVGSVAACVAHYAHGYLARHGLGSGGLAVEASYTMDTRPSRVRDIRISLVLPDGVPEERRAGLLAVASHCTLHETLAHAPAVDIGFAGTLRP